MKRKHPRCDCPSDASFGRTERLERRLKRAVWLNPMAAYMLGETRSVLEVMRIRRHGCIWHEPALRRIYERAGKL